MSVLVAGATGSSDCLGSEGGTALAGPAAANKMIIYMVRYPIAVARRVSDGRVTTEVLPIGTLLKLAYQPPPIGMIEARWKGERVLLYTHDLQGCADPIHLEAC